MTYDYKFPLPRVFLKIVEEFKYNGVKSIQN